MNLKEAAQQELEYIEQHAIISGAPIRDALRAALSEDRVADTGKTSDHFPDAGKMVATINELETVEPVACMHEFDGVTTLNMTPPNYYGDHWKHTALYSTPPITTWTDAHWIEYERGIVTAERERIKQASAPEIEKINAHIKTLEKAVATERERIAAWVEDMCAGMDAKTIANGIRNGGNDDIRAFEVRK